MHHIINLWEPPLCCPGDNISPLLHNLKRTPGFLIHIPYFIIPWNQTVPRNDVSLRTFHWICGVLGKYPETMEVQEPVALKRRESKHLRASLIWEARDLETGIEGAVGSVGLCEPSSTTYCEFYRELEEMRSGWGRRRETGKENRSRYVVLIIL